MFRYKYHYFFGYNNTSPDKIDWPTIYTAKLRMKSTESCWDGLTRYLYNTLVVRFLPGFKDVKSYKTLQKGQNFVFYRRFAGRYRGLNPEFSCIDVFWRDADYCRDGLGRKAKNNKG